MMQELRRHGYEISPGTLYPLLARLEARGWLRCKIDPAGGPRARKEYSLTANGRKALSFLKKQVEELYREVVRDEEDKGRPNGL
jgi:DNA-binding PadR family transcriptional regulator